MRSRALVCCVGLAALTLLSGPAYADEVAAPATPAAATQASASPDAADDQLAQPTHKQSKVIPVNPSNLETSSLKSFCLAADGNILAACGTGAAGEVRVFSPTGEYVSSWTLPVTPEAINVGSDGYLYVAGGGELLRLTADGEVALQRGSPHLDGMDDRRDEIRQQIVEQQKRNYEQYNKQRERYQQVVDELEAKQAELEDKGESLAQVDKVRLESAQRMKEQWDTIMEQVGAVELTEEQLEQRVNASLQSNAAVASISETGGDVFIATRAPVGYSFVVWRMSKDFTDAEMIAEDLRGCCGQMDVQACAAGVYVAENSRHRVYCVSREGDELRQWGEGQRQGVRGFGSCCNPMNVAFGPDDTVYTAESTSGRIKRYSAQGELLELVGNVEIVPGCKKVSIAVDQTGDRVYMLDITRNHIVLMERQQEAQRVAEKPDAAAGAAAQPRSDASVIRASFESTPVSGDQ